MPDELLGFLAYLVGLTLLFLELFIPSGGVLGIIGSLCSLYGVWVIMSWNSIVGVVIIVVTAVYVIILLKFWAKRVTMSSTLEGADGSSSEAAPPDLVGKEGESVTVLRPVGFAVIGGKRYQVVNDRSYLAKGERIRVVEVSGNRIMVTRVSSDN